MGTIQVQPYLLGREGNCLIGGFERPYELTGQNESEGQIADIVDAQLPVALPLSICVILFDQRRDDRDAIAVCGERLAQPVLSGEQVTYVAISCLLYTSPSPRD